MLNHRLVHVEDKVFVDGVVISKEVRQSDEVLLDLLLSSSVMTVVVDNIGGLQDQTKPKKLASTKEKTILY